MCLICNVVLRGLIGESWFDFFIEVKLIIFVINLNFKSYLEN